MERRLLTLEQVAEVLGVGKWVVKGLVQRGELKELRLSRKTIRFDRRDVDAYIRRVRRRSR
jgi:excisionase family DNA binding protein